MWLDTMYLERSFGPRTIVRAPLLDCVRDNPRFQEMVHRISTTAPGI